MKAIESKTFEQQNEKIHPKQISKSKKINFLLGRIIKDSIGKDKMNTIYCITPQKSSLGYFNLKTKLEANAAIAKEKLILESVVVFFGIFSMEEH